MITCCVTTIVTIIVASRTNSQYIDDAESAADI